MPPFFGVHTYNTLLAHSLNLPYAIPIVSISALSHNLKSLLAIREQPFIPPLKGTPFWNSLLTLETLLTLFSSGFNNAAKSCLVNDLLVLIESDRRAMIEIIENRNLLEKFFEIGVIGEDNSINKAIINIHKYFIKFLIQSESALTFSVIRERNSLYQLHLLNALLSDIIKNLKTCGKDKMEIICTQLIYLLEDICMKDYNVFHVKLFVPLLSKLLLLVDKCDLIYVSYPTLSLFDERSLLGIEKEKSLAKEFSDIEWRKGKIVLREGGILRILLKIIFFSLKFDSTENAENTALLKHLLFRTKETRKRIKEMSGLLASEEIKKEVIEKMSSKPKVEAKRKEAVKSYNIIDLIYSLEESQRHIKIVQSYQQKMVEKDYPSILDRRKGKDKGVYEEPIVLLIQIIAPIFQLLLYDLFQLSSLSQEEITMSDISPIWEEFHNNSLRKSSKLFNELVKIFIEIIDADPDLKKSNFMKLLSEDVLKKITDYNRKAILFVSKESISLMSQFNPLDTIAGMFSRASVWDTKPLEKFEEFSLKENYAVVRRGIFTADTISASQMRIDQAEKVLEDMRKNWRLFTDSFLHTLYTALLEGKSDTIESVFIRQILSLDHIKVLHRKFLINIAFNLLLIFIASPYLLNHKL